jgi:hypothetical protein
MYEHLFHQPAEKVLFLWVGPRDLSSLLAQLGDDFFPDPFPDYGLQ